MYSVDNDVTLVIISMDFLKTLLNIISFHGFLM